MIYHFILDHRIGGQHVYVKNLMPHFPKSLSSVIVTTGQGPMTERSLLNLRHFWPPLYALEVVINAAWIVFDVLLGRIKRDGLIFNVHGGANIAPILAARIIRIPVIWVIHETTSSYSRFIAIGCRVLRKTNYKIAIVAERSRLVYGLDNTVLLPASVDEKFWSREKVNNLEKQSCDWQHELSGGKQPLRLVAVGNLNPLKGFDVLLEALTDLQVSFHLQIVGSELTTHQQYAGALYQQAESFSSAKNCSRIDFLGWQDEVKVRALLASCDIFVLPSRSEACPIALLEAMAMGCRIIAADVGDVCSMLAHYPNARIFQTESVTSCTEALTLEADSVYVQSQQIGENHIGELWRAERVAAETASLYEQLLSD